MLEVIRNSKGDILCACEWYIVDSKGNFDNTGKWIWIEQLHISNSVNGNSHSLMKQMIRNVCKLVPWAEFGYFNRREKYKGRMRIYSRRQWLQFAEEKNVTI